MKINIKLSINKFILLTALLAFASFGSCVSFGKDISVSSLTNKTDNRFSKIEEMIVPLEVAGGTQARRAQDEITKARQTISGMEKETAVDADYSGRLIAWSGRLAILEGRYSEASRLYRQSSALSPGNIPSIILGIRLEGDPEKRLGLIEKELAIMGQNSTGYGELQIERARALLDANRFSEAAGAFDAAFASGLSKVYNANYGTYRERAWELRNTAGANAGTLEMLGQASISWKDCIAITKSETQLFRFLTGGRSLSDAELFDRLLERAFIPYTQDINLNEWPRAKPRIEDSLTRSGAAWFIWHLYAEARADRGLLSRYSARYATGANPRSPIADIPPLSPFFDSILGCVETELLSLPDGRNFRPAQPIKGAELLSVLKKIDN